MHEAIESAITAAGYQILDAVQIEQGGRIEFLVTKGGLKGRIGMPPDTSQAGIDELLSWLRYRWQKMTAKANEVK